MTTQSADQQKTTALAMSAIMVERQAPELAWSFSLLNEKTRQAVYAVQAFILTAADIADGHDVADTQQQLSDFEYQTMQALETRESSNAILEAFSEVYHRYRLDHEQLQEVFAALRLKIRRTNFSPKEHAEYVRGMGEAPMLMTLRILCYHEADRYHRLTPAFQNLGAAVCKLNLLRNHGHEHKKHNRTHFPKVTKATFNRAKLAEIVVDIESSFRLAAPGIIGLRDDARLSMAALYAYHYRLFRKVKPLSAEQIAKTPIELSGVQKSLLRFNLRMSPQRVVTTDGF